MTRLTAAKRVLLAPLLAAVIAACGATPPQAPSRQAMKLSVATGGISTACGFAYQANRFPGAPHAQIESIEAAATSSAKKLASVYARNQAWIYQGETVHEIVRDALSMLSACGLTDAERTLRAATSH